MPAAEDLPERPENHVRSTWSTREFASILPSGWLVHPLEEDYGIDRRVEIFENGRTTGVFFNVQLKSTKTGSGQKPAKSIKRSTLNYWAQTPDATLVVIAHDPTETIWYRWAHLLPHDENPETKSRQVRCESILSRETAPTLADEARAWRMARNLSSHVPVDIHLTGTYFYGESASQLKRILSQRLSSLPSFMHVVHGTPTLPYMRVAIEDGRIMAGIKGHYTQQLTYEFNGPRDYGPVAADVIVSLALSCASVGAEDLCVRLLKIAAPESLGFLESDRFGYAIAMLTRHGENDTVLTLVRRVAANEDHPSRDIALAAVASAEPSHELMDAVAFAVRDAARAWRRPAAGLYNAGNALRASDPAQALTLFEEAANADPAYKTRAYWWREKGTAHWSNKDVIEAEMCYRRAVELGDAEAHAYLADVLMRTGRYAEARDAFEAAPIWNGPQDAPWRLSYNVLGLIVEELEIPAQERASLAIPEFYPRPVDDSLKALEATALAAIREDALNGWAYSGLAASWASKGDRNALMASAAAALIVNVAPYLWLHLIVDAFSDETNDDETRMAFVQEAMLCAWRNFGEAFTDEILENPLLPDDLRTPVVELFEAIRLERPPMELREHRRDGTFESFFIPTGRKRWAN